MENATETIEMKKIFQINRMRHLACDLRSRGFTTSDIVDRDDTYIYFTIDDDQGRVTSIIKAYYWNTLATMENTISHFRVVNETIGVGKYINFSRDIFL